MSPDSEALFQAARQLPEEDRLLLASRLLDSVPENLGLLFEDDPGFLDELRRRALDDSGAVDADDLLKEP